MPISRKTGLPLAENSSIDLPDKGKTTAALHFVTGLLDEFDLTWGDLRRHNKRVVGIIYCRYNFIKNQKVDKPFPEENQIRDCNKVTQSGLNLLSVDALPYHKISQKTLLPNPNLVFPKARGEQIKFSLEYVRKIIADFSMTWHQLGQHNEKIYRMLRNRQFRIENSLMGERRKLSEKLRIKSDKNITLDTLDALEFDTDRLDSFESVFSSPSNSNLHIANSASSETDIYSRILKKYELLLTTGQFTLGHLRKICPIDARSIDKRQSRLRIPKARRLSAASVLTPESIKILRDF